MSLISYVNKVKIRVKSERPEQLLEFSWYQNSMRKRLLKPLNSSEDGFDPVPIYWIYHHSCSSFSTFDSVRKISNYFKPLSILVESNTNWFRFHLSCYSMLSLLHSFVIPFYTENLILLHSNISISRCMTIYYDLLLLQLPSSSPTQLYHNSIITLWHIYQHLL